jgi:hypothetical protein
MLTSMAGLQLAGKLTVRCTNPLIATGTDAFAVRRTVPVVGPVAGPILHRTVTVSAANAPSVTVAGTGALQDVTAPVAVMVSVKGDGVNVNWLVLVTMYV